MNAAAARLRRWMRAYAAWRARCGWPVARISAALGVPAQLVAELLCPKSGKEPR